METACLKAATEEHVPDDLLSAVHNHFGDDLHPVEFCTEFSMLKNTMQGVEPSFQSLKQKICNYRELFPDIKTATMKSTKVLNPRRCIMHVYI